MEERANESGHLFVRRCRSRSGQGHRIPERLGRFRGKQALHAGARGRPGSAGQLHAPVAGRADTGLPDRRSGVARLSLRTQPERCRNRLAQIAGPRRRAGHAGAVQAGGWRPVADHAQLACPAADQHQGSRRPAESHGNAAFQHHPEQPGQRRLSARRIDQASPPGGHRRALSFTGWRLCPVSAAC